MSLLEKASERLKSVEDRLEAVERKLSALEDELKQLAHHRHPEYVEVKALKELSESRKVAEGVTSFTRSLEAKYGALSRAVEEMKAELARHGKLLEVHHKGLKARTEDDKLANEYIGDLYKRVKALEEAVERVTTLVVKLHPTRFKKVKKR